MYEDIWDQSTIGRMSAQLSKSAQVIQALRTERAALLAVLVAAEAMDAAIDTPERRANECPEEVWYALGDLRDAIAEARALVGSGGEEE